MKPEKILKRAKGQAALGRWFARAHPAQSIISIGCLLLAGVLDGIGIAATLPLLREIVTPDTDSETAVGQVVEGAFTFIGLEPSVGPLLVFIVIVLSVKSGLLLFAFTQVGYAAAQVTRDMRMKLIRELMHVRWEYLTNERTGNFTAAIGSEAQRASHAYLQLCHILAGLIQVIVYFVLAMFISLWATLFAAVVGIMTMIALSRFVRMSRNSGRRQSKLIRSFNNRLIEGLNAMKSIKAMHQERLMKPLLEMEIDGLNHAQRHGILAKQSLRALQEPILVVSIAVGLYVMLDIWPGRLEVLFAISFLFLRTVTRLNTLQRDYAQLVQMEPAFWFLHNLTDNMRRQRELPGQGREPVFEKEIRFVNVSFAYSDHPVLRNVSMSIPANRVTTLIGGSGAGKTTTVDLIIGLIQPTEGQILMDDAPMETLDLYAWRSRIGYVPQETVMFHDTVLNNVTLGDEAVSREEVIEALCRAEALDFVEKLPKGLDSIVGERGMRLSGGQRQRIAIARAMVRHPDLLILDEATTALDPVTEAGYL
ncbi:MAG: ABC transporter ATP-binding protein [Gammaproteobacteria bacterium]|nr:ABC transporter ATP-binding protein [Gammaproteobacteria bacterium]